MEKMGFYSEHKRSNISLFTNYPLNFCHICHILGLCQTLGTRLTKPCCLSLDKSGEDASQRMKKINIHSPHGENETRTCYDNEL